MTDKKNTVTEERVDAILDASPYQEATLWGKEHLVSYLLPNGFTVLGRAALVDPANFDLELGRKYAREDAKRKLWQLEGYLLQNRLYVEGTLNA